MTKNEFTAQIYSRLKGMPEEDLARSLDYYSEMIDDRIEDGLTEDEAVEALGSVDSIVSQIEAEHSMPEAVSEIKEEPVRQRRKLCAWQIVLLILGAPLWLPLVLAAAIIALAVYIVLWSVIIVLYSADLSLAAGAVSGIVCAAVLLFSGEFFQAAFMLGAGLVCGGLAVLFFFVCNLAAKGIIILTKKTAYGIKSVFTGKEKA